jgi:hypothetical protein
MRLKTRRLANVFSDKASIVLRALLREPDRKWSITQLVAEGGVSEAQVIIVLDLLEDKGWVTRDRQWRNHSVKLENPQKLLQEWIRNYRLDWNPTALYPNHSPHFIHELTTELKKWEVPFALTGLSGARLIAPYVIQTTEYIYLLTDQRATEDILRKIETRFLLPYPASAGNIHFMVPYYANAIPKSIQTIKGLPVVSNLQLYLDLINEPTTGADQANWLWEHLKERGTPIVSAKMKEPEPGALCKLSR